MDAHSHIGLDGYGGPTGNTYDCNELKGDALIQKTYSEDFLDKRHKNRGKVQQYYVIGGHEAIVGC